MKLISMTSFALQQWEQLPEEPNYLEAMLHIAIVQKYAEFLKQPLTLGMFVPVDKQGNILKGKPFSPAPDSEWIRWKNEEFEFYEAKEKVLFKGFVKAQDFEERTLENKDLNIHINLAAYSTLTIQSSLGLGYGEIKTVEDLVNLEMELTESALKEIGINRK